MVCIYAYEVCDVCRKECDFCIVCVFMCRTEYYINIGVCVKLRCLRNTVVTGLILQLALPEYWDQLRSSLLHNQHLSH